MATNAAHRWTADDIPDQHGRTAVITGANTGLGFETARLLAAHGATVILACRHLGKADAAAHRIRTLHPAGDVQVMQLDLASMASIRHAADQLHVERPHIDVLINNAGAVRLQRAVTEDGFEETFATNHLGPFAFTGLVLDLMTSIPGSRVVTVSSIAHRRGHINFDDPQYERTYNYMNAYRQAKLANLLFTYELDRRLAAAGAPTIAVAAHPGSVRTDFFRDMSLMTKILSHRRLRMLSWWGLQDPWRAALGSVRAAVDPDVCGGEYYGPPGRAQLTGYPVRIESKPNSHDVSAQRRLWQESEQMAGITYPLSDLDPGELAVNDQPALSARHRRV